MCEGYDEAFARYTSGDASALDEWEMEVEEAEEDGVVAQLIAQPEVRKGTRNMRKTPVRMATV